MDDLSIVSRTFTTKELNKNCKDLHTNLAIFCRQSHALMWIFFCIDYPQTYRPCLELIARLHENVTPLLSHMQNNLTQIVLYIYFLFSNLYTSISFTFSRVGFFMIATVPQSYRRTIYFINYQPCVELCVVCV